MFKDEEEVRGRVGLKGCSLATVAFRKSTVCWDNCM